MVGGSGPLRTIFFFNLAVTLCQLGRLLRSSKLNLVPGGLKVRTRLFSNCESAHFIREMTKNSFGALNRIFTSVLSAFKPNKVS